MMSRSRYTGKGATVAAGMQPSPSGPQGCYEYNEPTVTHAVSTVYTAPVANVQSVIVPQQESPKAKVPGYRIECQKTDGFWAAKRHFVPGPAVEIKASELDDVDIRELEATDPRYLLVEKIKIEV
jgi:hypothetical protein